MAKTLEAILKGFRDQVGNGGLDRSCFSPKCRTAGWVPFFSCGDPEGSNEGYRGGSYVGRIFTNNCPFWGIGVRFEVKACVAA
jgi:hypothetical protein